MTSDKPSTGSGQPRIYLTGLAICLAVLAPLTGLLVYTLVIHNFRFTSGALLTSAPSWPHPHNCTCEWFSREPECFFHLGH